MELRVLFRLLASLQILPRPVSPAAPLPAPTVSVDPQLPMYVPGERLTLRCSAPQGLAVSSYQFYNQRGEWVFSESAGPAGGPWLVLMAAMGKAGAYSCDYWAARDGQNLYSSRSQPVRVTVMDRPLAPSISATAGGPWNDSVTIMCSLHGSYMPTTFQIFKNGHLVPSESSPESTHGARIQLHTSDPYSAGSYTCSYQIDVSGRKVESGLSSLLSIHLPAPPAAPTLSLHQQYTVYLRGETVNLMCLEPPGTHRAVGFQFSRDGGKTFLPGSSNTLALHLAGPEDSGSYTCAYWIQPSQWGVRSRESQPVSISVTDHPVAPSISAIAGGPWYDSVTIVCSSHGSYMSPTFQIFKNGKLVQLEYTPSSQGAQFQLHTSDPRTAGSYTCSYQIDVSGRKVESRLSSPLSIHLPEPPGAPTLSLHQQYTVYLRGETVSLTCLEPLGAHRAVGFQFFRDGGKTILPGSSNTLALHLAGLEDSGSYTCAYWIQPSQWGVRSRESQPVSISVMDYPPKPSVSLYPDYPAYVAGERVEIRCSAPPGTSPEQFGFYQSGTVIGHQPGNTSTWQLDLQANGTRNATRSFFCIYEQQIQGRPVPSYTSDPVSNPVFPALAAPSLQLIPPHLHYVTGETVTAKCVIPAGPYEPRVHWLQRDEEPGAEMLGARRNLTITPSTRGRYRCGYSTELHGRRLQSPTSPPVPVDVTDPLPQPVLSVVPPSTVVGEGLPLLLTCTAPGDAREWRFHFYKDGVELVPGDLGSEINRTEPGSGSVLSLPWASLNSTGVFTCGYEVNMSGRWIPSCRSQDLIFPVTISPGSIQDWPLWLPLVAGCAGAVLLLSLLLLICLCRRRRKGGVMAPTRTVYGNRPFGVGTALQEWSHDGKDQLVTHNQPTWPHKPGVGQPLQDRAKREEDVDTRVINPIYSTPTPHSTFAQQRGGNSILEDVVYSEIP